MITVERQKEGINLTAVIVTVNLNRVEKTKDGVIITNPDLLPASVTLKLTNTVNKLFENMSDLQQVIGKRPYIESVKASQVGVEIGSHNHYVHAHVAIEIYHWLLRYSLGALQERVRDYYTGLFSAIGETVYVNTTFQGNNFRNPNKAIMYATKEARRRNALGREYNEEEYDRLTEIVSRKTTERKADKNNDAAAELAEAFERKLAVK